MNTLKSLSDLNEETMSLINNQLAIEALDAGETQLGIETLQTSAKDGTNAAALYNLGICYERGIGVEQDRAKVNTFCYKSNFHFHLGL
jgi:TPR repeat protein